MAVADQHQNEEGQNLLYQSNKGREREKDSSDRGVMRKAREKGGEEEKNQGEEKKKTNADFRKMLLSGELSG